MDKNIRIRKDDKVMVIAGKDKGKIGKVIRLIKKHDTVLVEKINVVKRHQKGNPYTGQAGGIVEKHKMGRSNYYVNVALNQILLGN